MLGLRNDYRPARLSGAVTSCGAARWAHRAAIFGQGALLQVRQSLPCDPQAAGHPAVDGNNRVFRSVPKGQRWPMASAPAARLRETNSRRMPSAARKRLHANVARVLRSRRRLGWPGQRASGIGTKIFGGRFGATAHVQFLVNVHQVGPDRGKADVQPRADFLI